MSRIYNLDRSAPDVRDRRLSFAGPVPNRPAFVDLYSVYGPPSYDQGNLGSCTGNGIAYAVAFTRAKQKLKDFSPSRLFIYYNERVLIDTIAQDSGATVKDGIKTVNKQGVCSEDCWPYKVEKFTKKPTVKSYTAAKKSKVASYASVDQKNLKDTIANGFPIVFGFEVYESFESEAVAKTGLVPMPTQADKVLGGHCVVIVGYDEAREVYICRNSWGNDWGDKGRFYMPVKYVEDPNMAYDFWVVTGVTG